VSFLTYLPFFRYHRSMRKSFLIASALLVLSATPTFAVYRTEGTQPTPGEDGAALMSATTDVGTAPKEPRAIPMEKTTALTGETKSRMMIEKDELKDKMMEARNGFKAKLQGIKDARKQKTVENIDSRISEMNKKRTDMMSEKLTRMTSILEKISAKATALKTEGKSTTTLEADILAATTAIDTAKTAVTDQAAKDYVMNVTTDAALKTGAKTLVTTFITDIKATMEKVILAQKAVAKAARGAGLLMEKPSVTPTVTSVMTP